MNLTLPTWANTYFPDGKLLDGIIAAYNIGNSTPLLKRLYAGKTCIQRLININNSSLQYLYYSMFFFYRPNNSCHVRKYESRKKWDLIKHENLFIQWS